MRWRLMARCRGRHSLVRKILMRLDPVLRIALLFGVVTMFSWLLLAHEGFASPVRSIAIGVMAFIVVYGAGVVVRRRLDD